MDYRKHGLSGAMKRRVFDALLERQQGKCFFCWISQAEIEEKARTSTWKHAQSPVHATLHIDHCHITGSIRGLLCGECNLMLGTIENYGVGVEDDYTPPNIDEWDRELYERMIERAHSFLDRYRTIIQLYMQRERWLPRKDILAHLQACSTP